MNQLMKTKENKHSITQENNTISTTTKIDNLLRINSYTMLEDDHKTLYKVIYVS